MDSVTGFTINKTGQHIFSFRQRLLLHSKLLCDETQPIGTVDVNPTLTNSPSITVYS
jgi:hypothetical protein